MHFASDNASGVAPEVLDALAQANHGYALGYGNDDWTRKVERRMAEIFEHEVAVFLCSTGTASNAIAIAHVTPPWGGVLCHAESHIMTDECGAPEFYGGGLKLIGYAGEGGKLTAETVEGAIERYSGRSPHQVNAATLSLTQATEAGTIYRAQEIAALAGIARARGVKVHMDGARFGNALARLNASPADITWKAGVDVLSFGATKSGALAAEAIVFFDPKLAAMMPERRKRGGNLWSKHRFLAAQFDAFLADDLWLRLSRHANAMADRLSAGLKAAGLSVVWPVEANLVFAILPGALDEKLKAAGASYYVRRGRSLPPHIKSSTGDVLVRLVTSFTTQPEDVDRFLGLVQKG